MLKDFKYGPCYSLENNHFHILGGKKDIILDKEDVCMSGEGGEETREPGTIDKHSKRTPFKMTLQFEVSTLHGSI